MSEGFPRATRPRSKKPAESTDRARTVWWGVVRAWGIHRGTDRCETAPGSPVASASARALLSLALAVVVAALCGCGSTTVTASQAASSPRNASVSAAPVALHLDSGSYTLSVSSTTISGTVARGSKVTVNGRRASVHAGRWSTTLVLHLGKNRVTVRATLRGHPAGRRRITVTREKTPAEVEAEAPAVAPTTESEQREGSAPQSTPTTPASPPAETCTNGTYVNSAGNTVCRPEQSPTVPAGATAECVDGTYSFSQSRSGTCSHHGGVAKWL
jgi:resuscitation-promoting factor RpfB